MIIVWNSDFCQKFYSYMIKLEIPLYVCNFSSRECAGVPQSKLALKNLFGYAIMHNLRRVASKSRHHSRRIDLKFLPVSGINLNAELDCNFD